MQRTADMRRMIAAFVLVFSTAVSALLPIADAYAEVAAADQQTHVEQPGSKGCPPAHDEVACQLCRVLRLDAPRAANASWAACLLSEPSVPVTCEAVPPLAKRAPSSAPRGPPVA